MLGPNKWVTKVLIKSSNLCKKELMKWWHNQLKWTPLWNKLWQRYYVTLKKKANEMLVWSTEMNAIMEGTLTKILGVLRQRLTSQKETVGFLASCVYHFYQNVNNIKCQFCHLLTLFSDILQIYLNAFFFFIWKWSQA